VVPRFGYEFLPHTTDAYIQATGATFEEALENAGRALFHTMCDVNSISLEFVEEVEVQGADEVTLLYGWLESLLLKFELEGKVYAGFEVVSVRRSDGFRAHSRISGEKYDKRKHGGKVEVKAVTYHRMEVIRNKAVVIVRFILDL